MGEVKVVKDRSINRVIDLMRKDGLDEERAIKIWFLAVLSVYRAKFNNIIS